MKDSHHLTWKNGQQRGEVVSVCAFLLSYSLCWPCLEPHYIIFKNFSETMSSWEYYGYLILGNLHTYGTTEFCNFLSSVQKFLEKGGHWF